MSNTDLLSRLELILTPPVASRGLHLEQVALTGPPNRRVLRLTVDLPDGPGGVDSDDLEQVTREVSEVLDVEDPLKNAYQLEVTTPGVDRPLRTGRHFRRNEGRLVKIRTNAPEPVTITGRITSATETAVTIDTDGGEQTLKLDEIDDAKVELEFRRRGR